MEIWILEQFLAKIKIFALILLISLPLAGCSVLGDDYEVDDKPWNKPAGWENQGIQLPTN